MRTSSSYDAVVLGTEMHGLLAGALLAKRGFRVLVVGQGHRALTYRIGEHTLPQRPFAFVAAQAPMPRQVMSELSLNQLFRRKAVEMDPVLQIATKQLRFDLAPDQPLLAAEIAREFPTVRRPVEDVFRTVERLGAELDQLFERHVRWPPQSFLEKREFARATQHGSPEMRGRHWDPVTELPPGHPFRTIVELPAFFTSRMDPAQLPGLATCRLLEDWWRGAARLEGGEPWLRAALIEKIRAHSGEVREKEQASGIEVRRGRVHSVHLATSETTVGAGAVIAACDVDQLLRLLPDRSALSPMFERRGEPQLRWFRYTLNVIVRADAVPEGMARDVFYRADGSAPLGGTNGIHVEVTRGPGDGLPDDQRLLCVEALLSRRDVEGSTTYLDNIRGELMKRLGELVPFVERHVVMVDSPHDGRDAEVFSSRNGDGAGDDVDAQGRTAVQNEPQRTLLQSQTPWDRGPHAMERVYGYPVRNALGLCALPARTPIKRLLLSGPHTIPALGLEGAFIAASGVAALLTSGDRSKAWVRKGWTKIEL